MCVGVRERERKREGKREREIEKERERVALCVCVCVCVKRFFPCSYFGKTLDHGDNGIGKPFYIFCFTYSLCSLYCGAPWGVRLTKICVMVDTAVCLRKPQNGQGGYARPFLYTICFS